MGLAFSLGFMNCGADFLLLCIPFHVKAAFYLYTSSEESGLFRLYVYRSVLDLPFLLCQGTLQRGISS